MPTRDPGKFFTADISHREHRALILLNQPLKSKSLLNQLWRTCGFHVCADGAANRLHDLYDGAVHSLPDSIHGDLDSIRPEVRQYYSERGVSITRDPDQYSTDFGKAVQWTTEHASAVKDVLVVGGLGGRVDHGIGMLGELLRYERLFRRSDGFKIWLVSEQSVSFWVDDNESCSIMLDSTRDDATFTPNCGILPLQGKAHITTKGFEWDVTDWETELGGQVSTSNHVVSNMVDIKTDTAVLFTIERK